MKQRMPEFKESAAFKLFGKTISILQLSLDQEHDGASCADNEAACQDCSDRSSSNSEEEQERKDGNLRFQEPSVELIPDEKQEEGTPNQVDEDSKDTILLSVSENLKTPSAEGETSSIKSCKNGEQSDSSTSDEKTLKKPDKIIPCPRCSSMETKFCYYNNYNVNQPRHFCKNCQRYWTAGGTMRSVPMGAGRRKNKSSATAQYRHHLMVSEALRTVQAHALSGVHNSSFGNNSTVLNFGSDSPLCESVASALSISHKAHSGATDWNNRPSECSVLSLNSLPKGGNDRSQEAAAIENCQGFPPQLQCFPGPAWPCPWNPAMPPPTFGPSGFPVSFYSAPRYWGYAVPDPRNISALNHCAPVRSPTSPLGKHSRDGEVLNPGSSEELSRESNNSDKTVFVPKTLRIDDPSEAAMSSVWGTLGIKHEKSSSMNGGLFKGFQSISKEKYLTERSSLLQANPAAMSRSQNFHEIL